MEEKEVGLQPADSFTILFCIDLVCLCLFVCCMFTDICTRAYWLIFYMLVAF